MYAWLCKSFAQDGQALDLLHRENSYYFVVMINEVLIISLMISAFITQPKATLAAKTLPAPENVKSTKRILDFWKECPSDRRRYFKKPGTLDPVLSDFDQRLTIFYDNVVHSVKHKCNQLEKGRLQIYVGNVIQWNRKLICKFIRGIIW